MLSVVRLVTQLRRSRKGLYIVSLIKNNNGCLWSAFQPTGAQLLLSRRELLRDLCRGIVLHVAEPQPPLEGMVGAIELAGDPRGPDALSAVLPHARNTLTNACHGKTKAPACKLTHTAPQRSPFLPPQYLTFCILHFVFWCRHPGRHLLYRLAVE